MIGQRGENHTNDKEQKELILMIPRLPFKEIEHHQNVAQQLDPPEQIEARPLHANERNCYSVNRKEYPNRRQRSVLDEQHDVKQENQVRK